MRRLGMSRTCGITTTVTGIIGAGGTVADSNRCLLTPASTQEAGEIATRSVVTIH